MKIQTILASGQGIVPFIMIGLPAAAAGILCLAISVFLELTDRSNKVVRGRLAILGLSLLLVAIFSPALDPLSSEPV